MSIWTRWLNSLNATSKKTRRLAGKTDARKRARQWLGVEHLEDRVVPSVLTADKPGYAPTEAAVLTGSGFQHGETINLSVVRGDGTSYSPWSVTDGGAGDLDGVADGNIKTNWKLPTDSPGFTFTATATGATSGSADASFNGLTTW